MTTTPISLVPSNAGTPQLTGDIPLFQKLAAAMFSTVLFQDSSVNTMNVLMQKSKSLVDDLAGEIVSLGKTQTLVQYLNMGLTLIATLSIGIGSLVGALGIAGQALSAVEVAGQTATAAISIPSGVAEIQQADSSRSVAVDEGTVQFFSQQTKQANSATNSASEAQTESAGALSAAIQNNGAATTDKHVR